MGTEDNSFDFQQPLKAIQSGKPLFGREGFHTPLIKNLTEAGLEGELVPYLARKVTANYRNGKRKIT